MKSKGKKELHTKTVKELQQLLNEIKQEIFKFKLELSKKKLKNVRSIFEKRKDMARVLTILKEKELVNENA